MNESTGTPDSGPSVEDRLASFFGGPAKPAAPAAPAAPSAPVEATEPEAEVQADQPDDQQDYEPAAEEEADGEPVEDLTHLDKTYKVPASLKKAFEESRAFATRTAQEAATIRRAVEAERIAVQTTAAFNQQVADLDAQIAQLQSYKEQAAKLDWSSLTLDQKVDLDRELRNVDSKLNQLGGEKSARYQEHQANFGRAVVQAVGETEKFMQQKVPGWSQEKGTELHQYGAQLGIPKERLVTGWFADPVATHVMWKAKQWDSLQASKPQVQNRSAAAPPVVKPGSNAVQKAVATSKYQQARSSLKKSGSLEDFAAVLLTRKG